MRLSTSMIYQSGLNGILNSQSTLLGIQQQISSGRRIVTPSDDPLGAGQAINAAQNLSMTGNFAANRAVAGRSLGLEDNALSSVISNLQGALARIVQAGDGTLSDADRQTLANVLGNSRDALLSLANSNDGNGQYLFSGYKGDAPAYTETAGVVTYAGDQGQRLIQVEQARQMAGADTGTDIFSRSAPGSNAYFAQAATGNAGTAIFSSVDVANGGANVGSNFKIDFEVDGAGVTTYRVTTTDASGTSTTAPPITDPGIAYAPGAKIDLGGVSVAISGAPANGDSINVTSASSAGAMDVFATLDSVVAALKQPSQGDDVGTAALKNMLATANKKITLNLDNVSTVRASVGARQNELDALGSTGNQRMLTDTKTLTDITGLDYYSAVSAMTMRNVSLQASMAAFQSIQGVSLFSTLK